MPTQVLSHPPGIVFPPPPPTCARCQEPLADVDILLADGRQCGFCANGIAVATNCPRCNRYLPLSERRLAKVVGCCALCGVGPETDEERDLSDFDWDQELARA